MQRDSGVREPASAGAGSPSPALPFLAAAPVTRRRNLREDVATALRAALVAGEMDPGQVYSAPRLAEHFGVSATPVREAMLDLASEGLVEVVPNKGFRVLEPSSRELDDITAVRALIEIPTVRAIAAGADERVRERVEALRPVAREIEEQAARGDLIAYVRADRHFHLALLELAGNDRLVSVVANLRDRTRLYGLQALAERGELAGSAGEHEELIDRILAGDADGAAALMDMHIGHVRGVWAGIAE